MGLRPHLELGIVVQPPARPLPDRHPVLGHRDVGHPPHPVQVRRPQGQTSGRSSDRLSHSKTDEQTFVVIFRV